MVIEVGYSIHCDCCGGEVSDWVNEPTRQSAEWAFLDNGWYFKDGEHLCPGCFKEWTQNENNKSEVKP